MIAALLVPAIGERAVERDDRTIGVERQALYWCIVIAYFVGVMLVVPHVPHQVLRQLTTAILVGFLVQYLTGLSSEEEQETRPFFLARPLWRRWIAIVAAGAGAAVAYIFEVRGAQLAAIVTGWGVLHAIVGVARRFVRGRGRERPSDGPESQDGLNEGAND